MGLDTWKMQYKDQYGKDWEITTPAEDIDWALDMLDYITQRKHQDYYEVKISRIINFKRRMEEYNMANCCEFEMAITGERENIFKLKDDICSKFRVYSCYAYDTDSIDSKRDISRLYIGGECAWSVRSAMVDYGLIELTEEYNVDVEIYSTEPGIGFQEHMLISKGDTIIMDCVDYEEHWIDDIGSVEAYNAEYGTDFTEDMVDDGYVYVGGFGDTYGMFVEDSDPDSFFV